MDCKGQVSLEYLLTVLFSVILAMIAATLALSITQISDVATTKITAYRDSAIASLLEG